jgi:hypothetical protein
MTSTFRRIAKLTVLATLVTTSACGSDDGDGDGGANTGGSGGSGGSPGNDNCGLDITLSGDATFDLPIDRGITCLTAYTTAPGAYVGFGPAPVEDIALVALTFPELDPGQTAEALDIPMTIHHADRTQFSPMGCVVDVTENSFHETTEGGDVYRVVGEGTCSEAGTTGGRSISVVGLFRFFAPIRWQD